ncbi:phosphatase PAP2 family protein [Nocardioides sp. CER19]|uniref:phosphatase PAP2 family protein n=1 Tax=Nocardioides sp. CER19 TaxID=3038538 RepID=UPI00244B71A8|nr:phosphatase PAP2 family protein [Nocardioides sp. CER19]MDH2413193.1 phosphatase PAP2 family protein [Nocardioides sp. CER19]
MPWPSWDEAAFASVLALFLALACLRLPQGRARTASVPALREFALISGLYAIWRLARQLPFTHEAGAVERGREIHRIQQWLHLPGEIHLQHVVVQHDWLARLVNAYYATLHVPALVAFLVWLWVRHRESYPHWRNGLVYVTLGCLVIRFIRVAPPRFIPELGFVDLSQRLGFQVYGNPGTGVSDQYAAMPSIHVAWAAVVALGVLCVARSPWRWLVLLHLPATMFVVAATGHHWWLDGVVALLLLWVGLWGDARWRRSRAATSDRRAVEVLEAA